MDNYNNSKYSHKKIFILKYKCQDDTIIRTLHTMHHLKKVRMIRMIQHHLDIIPVEHNHVLDVVVLLPQPNL